MSQKSNLQITLTHFNWSLSRLKESIDNEDTEYYRGAALNRFKLTCDVALETIRTYAKIEGKNCGTDISCFQWVENKNWLITDANWKIMVDHYKKVKIKPNKAEANEIYHKLRTYFLLLNNISECMRLKN